MALELRQNLKLSQTLKMTPQLQQAIKLLQLSRMELVELVREEMVENPVLEESSGQESSADDRPTDMNMEGVDQEKGRERQEIGADSSEVSSSDSKADGDAVREIDWDSYLEHYSTAPPMPSYRPNNEDLPSLEATLTRKDSLFDHLSWQLKMGASCAEDTELGMLILGNLDQYGYLKSSLDDIAEQATMPVEQIERVLAKIQTFDPIGVGARTLQECLLIQARHIGQDDDVLVQIVERHIGNLERKNYQAIARDLKQPLEEIYEAVKVIASLDPKPGRAYAEEDPIYITPDVYIHKLGDKYFVVPNSDGLPKLKISNFYRSALAGDQKARQYVQEKLRSAQWLIRSIEQRQRTIVKVTESILKFQNDFFEKGIEHLRPLILRDVADDISMHESTISRVTTNKYVHTPRGIFELKYFFNSSINRTDGDEIASQSVKGAIADIVSKENVKKPFSDQKIVEMLRDKNIDIARRTVAKYREQLGILSSSKRKQVI